MMIVSDSGSTRFPIAVSVKSRPLMPWLKYDETSDHPKPEGYIASTITGIVDGELFAIGP